MATASAVTTSIVRTLKEYGPIHIEFLAKVLGRRRSEILEYLDVLEREGVIRRTEEKVGLKE